MHKTAVLDSNPNLDQAVGILDSYLIDISAKQHRIGPDREIWYQEGQSEPRCLLAETYGLMPVNGKDLVLVRIAQDKVVLALLKTPVGRGRYILCTQISPRDFVEFAVDPAQTETEVNGLFITVVLQMISTFSILAHQ